MTAYYNEVDPYAAQWLRNLIAAGHIASGEVDERSIEDVHPQDLRGFTQCHFFAGIGVWSYALRRAGWRDDEPVWTGSCPCQPFSAAGKGAGFADERHLWPAWEWLIRHGKPRGVPVFGEQVASKDGLAWLDVVQADLEGQGYTVRAIDACAAGVGAPHIRQRLYFVADATGERRVRVDALQDGRAGGLVGHADNAGPQGRGVPGAVGSGHGASERAAREAGHVNGFWHPADWLPCIDGKARPVEPVAQQMVDGSTESLGRLRPEAIREIEKDVADAFRCEAHAGEALLDLRGALSEEAPRRWSAGRLLGVHEAPFLLAFMRQLSDQGWAFAQGLPCPSAQAAQAELRGVRRDVSPARAPHQRGLEGQPAGERADAMRLLSSILARHAQAAWGETFERHAADSFPLIHGAPARVGRLRAYGNAIVAPVAEEFIRAYMTE